MIDEMLASLDEGDAAAYAGFFAPDATFRFGNFETVRGREEIASSCGAFLDTIAGLKHRVIEQWNAGDVTVLKVEVDYQRLDDGEVTVPFAIIFTSQNNLVKDYQIYGDVTPVFAPPA